MSLNVNAPLTMFIKHLFKNMSYKMTHDSLRNYCLILLPCQLHADFG
jgi:hypothetical protein